MHNMLWTISQLRVLYLPWIDGIGIDMPSMTSYYMLEIFSFLSLKHCALLGRSVSIRWYSKFYVELEGKIYAEPSWASQTTEWSAPDEGYCVGCNDWPDNAGETHYRIGSIWRGHTWHLGCPPVLPCQVVYINPIQTWPFMNYNVVTPLEKP